MDASAFLSEFLDWYGLTWREEGEDVVVEWSERYDPTERSPICVLEGVGAESLTGDWLDVIRVPWD
ncbi:hypothetical protein ACE7GA_26245 [Roseomonas sp. CCTCC AB2023176]|uniref:hypothetical protein n=1 Tax=Roseomonas sp. CCTCC AB2023176 TaxID=3342640 RepID=UPI0035E094C9